MMRRFVMLALGLVGLLAVDRWLKSVALALRSPQGDWRIIDLPIGQFRLVENEGAVFSWPVPNALVIVVMLVAMLGLAWYGWRAWKKMNWRSLVGVALMFVGAGSNLYDRFAHGFVIDWAYLGPWWPVFNLADVMIGVGVVMLVWPKKLGGTPDTQPVV